MKRENFNRGWLFSKEGNESMAVSIDLPHDAMLLEKRDPNCTNGMNSAYFPGGKYIYSKKWSIPDEWENKTVTIEFEGIYRKSSVYINGTLAGGRPCGYSNFYVCCDGLLKYGEENEIIVKVNNSEEPNSRWYTGSGIYRDVKLIIGEKTHIDIDGVKISTVSIKPAIINIETAHSGGEVSVEIMYEGKVVEEAKGDNIKLEILDAKLWNDEQPNLYQAKVSLFEEDILVDEVIETFGIRIIEWASQKGLHINGQEVLLRGACVHHDNGILGACAHKDAEERRVRILKEAGFNAIRSSHNLCSKAMLNACDKYGVYVMDELYDMWYIHKVKYDYVLDFEEWHERDIEAMVAKDFNHPSVILYSIGNEVSETSQERGIKLIKDMQEQIHSLDNSRPVTCGINLLLNGLNSLGVGLYKDDGMELNSKKKEKSKKKQKLNGSTFINVVINRVGKLINNVGRMKFADKATAEAFSILDIAGYNYGSGRYSLDPKKYPDRIVIGTETFPPELAENWAAVERYPNLVGDFMWVGWDYLGESGIGAIGYESRGGMSKEYPYLLADSGIIDITGYMRPEVYFSKIVWGQYKKPYIGVEPLSHSEEKRIFSMWRDSDSIHSWSWNGYENKKARVIVYANAHKVELLLNGKSLGTAKVKSFRAKFNTVYKPGKLTAIAYDVSGKELGSDTLQTAKPETYLTLSPEQDIISTNGKELAYVNILLTDKDGQIKPAIDKSITIAVEGCGTLIGFGSANPYTEETFASTSHETYYGRAQAVLRAGNETGEIKVKVSCDGLESKEIVLKVE